VADQAAATAEQTFEQGGAGASLPEITLTNAELNDGVAAFRVFVMANLCASNGEARRLIRGGGARVNDLVLDSEDHAIGAADLSADGVIKLSAGKKRHALIRSA
jgi:tyrosyl-tRNA synthetase